MIPKSVSYTGLEFDPKSIHQPRKQISGTYSCDWTRHQFTVPFDQHVGFSGGMRKFDRWVERNIVGRFGSYTTIGNEGVVFVVLFEQTNDAVMFRMLDGETAWYNEDEDS